MEILIGDGTRIVRVITPGTPIAKALIGKSLGNEVNFRKGQEQPDCIRLLV
jgi:transcription elongation GreA/GreB family factor